ncbi:hypothetical protein SESBI_26023 [Sesbania bispinosa]|nr:hypothetical protein SESBI_26023 [Sesbania bispinosa]
MPHWPVILCRRQLLLMVVEGGGDRHKRQEVIGIRPRSGRRMQEVRRYRGAGEEVVGGGVSGNSRASSAAGAGGSSGGNALHAFQIKAVFLQVASDVFSGQTIDAHELHYGLWNRVFDSKVCHGVNEALVELWGPHKAWPFECAGRFLAGGAGPQFAGIGEISRGREG